MGHARRRRGLRSASKARFMQAGNDPWQKIKAPGGMAPNMYLSLVTTAGKSEVLTCIGGWGGGKLYYGALDTPSSMTWKGPLMVQDETFTQWAEFPNYSAIWGKCKTPTSCDPDVHPLGKFDALAACQKARPVLGPWVVSLQVPPELECEIS